MTGSLNERIKFEQWNNLDGSHAFRVSDARYDITLYQGESWRQATAVRQYAISELLRLEEYRKATERSAPR